MRALLLGMIFLTAAPDREDPTPKEKVKPLDQQLLGEWRLVKMAGNGVEERRNVATVLAFTPTEVHIHENGERQAEQDLSYRLDDAKKPAAIDLASKRDTRITIAGIVKVEGDVLTLCFTIGGKSTRPTAFVISRESDAAVLHFQRVKK